MSMPHSGRMILRIDRFLGCQIGCSGGNSRSLYSASGKDFGHQLAEALVELGAAAAGFGKDEAAAVDVVAQALLLLGGELRRVAGR